MKTTAGLARAQQITEKAAELEALKKNGRPLLLLMMVLALVTMVSALCGSLVGLPNGLHLITGPLLSVLTLIRIPAMKRMNALALEIRALEAE